jgi:hypothetical protein
MKAITAFRRSVRIRIPEVPGDTIDYYIRESIRDFCRRSLIWRDWLTNIDLIPAQGDVTGATRANPVVITAVANGRSSNDVLRLSAIGGMVEISDLYFTIANPTTDTFELSGIDGTTYTEYTEGGYWKTRDMPTYTLTPPSGSLIIKPTVVRYRRTSSADYIDIYPQSENDIDSENRDWRTSGIHNERCQSSCSDPFSWRTCGTEAQYYLPDTETIGLTWRPTEAVTDGLRIKAVLQPDQTATTVPDFLFNDWANEIRDGALAEIYAIPGKEWTNLDMATYHRGLYRNGWKEALRSAESSNTNKASSTQGSIGAYT